MVRLGDLSGLPPWSGFASCPKCGDTMGTTWHAGAEPDCRFKGGGEHLCRICPCCGYAWAEATADASKEPGLRSLPGGAGR